MESALGFLAKALIVKIIEDNIRIKNLFKDRVLPNSKDIHSHNKKQINPYTATLSNG